MTAVIPVMSFMQSTKYCFTYCVVVKFKSKIEFNLFFLKRELLLQIKIY